MAKPTTKSASKLSIWVGDGASPEEFVAPCGLTNRSFGIQPDTADTIVPDCDDPDAPAWKERATTSLDAPLSGSGVLAMEAFPTWREWSMSGLARNVRIGVDYDDTGYFEGRYIAAVTFKGEQGGKITVDVTLTSDGQVVWVAAA